jgi:hypothetical protein
MGQATATNYIIASMQVPTCVARIRPVHSWKFVKWPKVAEAEADAGAARPGQLWWSACRVYDKTTIVHM